MVDDLTDLVEMESPTDDKAALDRLGTAIGDRFQLLGASVEISSQEVSGSHVLARFGGKEGGALLLAHMDTVWPIGTIAGRPIRVEDGRLFGPGAFDMKGGIVVALWALRAIQARGFPLAGRTTVLLNADEETGSATSRALIEAEARTHDVVYVLEPAEPPNGALKTARKGVGMFSLTVSGTAAHAGADHAAGVNAIEELAHQVLTLQGFTDYAAGTTVNVGVVAGGTRSNVVPAQASARIDVRVTLSNRAKSLERAIRGLKPHVPGAKITVTGGMNRPPMVRTPAIAALFERAAAIADSLGFTLEEAASGGGSDGNFTAALGVPTLDGMGVVGAGGHAANEHALIASLPKRAAILAAMLAARTETA